MGSKRCLYVEFYHTEVRVSLGTQIGTGWSPGEVLATFKRTTDTLARTAEMAQALGVPRVVRNLVTPKEPKGAHWLHGSR